MTILQEIKAIIKNQLEEAEDDVLRELTLDSLKITNFTPEIKAEIEKYDSLCFLSLNGCGLNSLENFPLLPELEILELNDNKLGKQHLKDIAHLDKLQSLSLGGNLFKDLADIEELKNLKQISELCFTGCDIIGAKNYKEKLFEFFPNLKILDNCDQEGNELNDSEDEDELEKGAFEEDDEDDEEEDGGENDEDDEDGNDVDEDDDEEDDDEEDDDEEPTISKKVHK